MSKLCCHGCGYEFYDGEAYYEIGDMILCEDCINDCKRFYEVEEYTYQDYLTDKYELERHDNI